MTQGQGGGRSLRDWAGGAGEEEKTAGSCGAWRLTRRNSGFSHWKVQSWPGLCGRGCVPRPSRAAGI